MIRDVLRHAPVLADRYMVRLPVRESVSITSEPPLPVQADGDPVGFGSTTARVRRNAVLVRAPRSE